MSELFVWIGKNTTENERRNAMVYAHVSVGKNKKKKTRKEKKVKRNICNVMRLVFVSMI